MGSSAGYQGRTGPGRALPACAASRGSNGIAASPPAGTAVRSARATLSPIGEETPLCCWQRQVESPLPAEEAAGSPGTPSAAPLALNPGAAGTASCCLPCGLPRDGALRSSHHAEGRQTQPRYVRLTHVSAAASLPRALGAGG